MEILFSLRTQLISLVNRGFTVHLYITQLVFAKEAERQIGLEILVLDFCLVASKTLIAEQFSAQCFSFLTFAR